MKDSGCVCIKLWSSVAWTPCVLRSCIYACTKSLSLAWT